MKTKRSPYLKHLYVCVNRRADGRACCAGRDSERIREKLKEYVNAHGLKGKVRVSASGCMDLCEQGANVMVYPDHRWYSGVTLESVEQVIEEHLAPLVESANACPPASADLGRRGRTGEPARSSAVPLSPPRSLADSPIRAFLFDLGNVLVRFDHRAAAAKIVNGTGSSVERLFQMFFESPLVTAHDEGRISTREFYESLKKEINLPLPYGRFLEVWNDIFSEDREMTALVADLLGRYPCYLISNTNRPHFEHLRRTVPLLDRLHGWALSYEVGCLKPDPLIYRRALDLARLPPEEIFYVDDRDDLIQAAHSMGFQTHRFVGFEGLAEELKSRRLL